MIIGSAVLALSPPGTRAVPVQQGDGDEGLIILGMQLRQLHRRLRSLQRSADAWQQWSDAHDQLEALCNRISRTPTNTMAGLAVRYEALAVGLLEEGVLMDEDIRRQLFALRREMRRAANSSGAL